MVATSKTQSMCPCSLPTTEEVDIWSFYADFIATPYPATVESPDTNFSLADFAASDANSISQLLVDLLDEPHYNA
eukprot:TRINITY_DN4190_c0_g1_i1.p2 TRINITY_DN4190_c0_g1~~TRINITY_DN4190_c0_g1_i1.p2  ORF type:complete len:75 (-),score=17.36 TRINITY_DN4190_c0_g1_i1:81-305(-)